ncbi:MAG TPA: hypothetical protein VF509_11415 [Sphingobium sp.]
MPEPTTIFSTLAAKLSDLDLIEVWLVTADDQNRSPFEEAAAAELDKRYMAQDGRDRELTPHDEPMPRLYAGW